MSLVDIHRDMKLGYTHSKPYPGKAFILWRNDFSDIPSRRPEKQFLRRRIVTLRMSVNLRRLHNIERIPSSSTSFRPLPHFPRTTVFPLPSKTLVHSAAHNPQFDFMNLEPNYSPTRAHELLKQFLPIPGTNAVNMDVINPNERRRILVALSKMIKRGKGYVLMGFSRNFCPFLLVKIMKSFYDRRAAFAFFKLALQDHSDRTVNACCLVAHLLAAANLRFFAQDVLSWVIAVIGPCKGREFMEFMWNGHVGYESASSVLDSLMRAFMNARMFPLAIDVLSRMREVGVVPELSAINILLKSLVRIGDYGSVWKLFRDMVRIGPHPSNFTFAGLILWFCRRGCLEIGESLLQVMHKFQCVPDAYSYNILIHAFCFRGRTSEALHFLQLMIESDCSPTSATFSTLISAMCKEGKVTEARKVFDDWMHEASVYPNTIIYNTLIDGYFKAREVHEATKLFYEMRSKGVNPDCVTFNILICGLYKYGKEEDGDRLMREVAVSQLFPGEYTVPDILIAWLCWAGRLDEATTLLMDMLEKGVYVSVIAFNSIIAVYGREGLDDKAFLMYKTMVNYGHNLSFSTCNSLLMSLSNKGRMEEARNVMDRMIDKGFPLNKVAFTLLLDGYFAIGDVEAAWSMWKEMNERGMAPDAVTFSAFVNGLSNAGYLQEAYGVFTEMTRRGFVPNNFVYNSLIHGFCNCGRITEALKLEKDMRQRGLLPDNHTMNIIIHGFCKEGRMNFATDAFKDMYRTGLIPDIVTYNTLINGYCKAFDFSGAEAFLNKMQACGCEPDITTYNIYIHGLCSTERINQAVELLDELVSTGTIPNTVTYNIVMNGICRDKLDQAMMLTAKLLKMAFVPNIVTINLLLSHFCKQGLPEKTLIWGQRLREIGFEFDDVTFKIIDTAYVCNLLADTDNSRGAPEKSLFLDFLMYVSYDYISRNRQCIMMGNTYVDLTDGG